MAFFTICARAFKTLKARASPPVRAHFPVYRAGNYLLQGASPRRPCGAARLLASGGGSFYNEVVYSF
jgi:hypothetical protein